MILGVGFTGRSDDRCAVMRDADARWLSGESGDVLVYHGDRVKPICFAGTRIACDLCLCDMLCEL